MQLSGKTLLIMYKIRYLRTIHIAYFNTRSLNK
nr:MAG TPA: hypothetical protein [Crassvirales sp.]